MGTEIELLVDGDQPDTALDAAEHEFHRLEALLSRFRDDSELSRLNRDGSIDPGADLARVVDLALEARAKDGRAVRPDGARRGRRRRLRPHFEQVPAHPDALTPPPAATWGGRRAFCQSGHIELDDGVRLDLGGIGKGYAAERAAELLALAGDCLVNAGGDIAIRGGRGPSEWTALTLQLTGGGLATSGRDRRRWERGGREPIT